MHWAKNGCAVHQLHCWFFISNCVCPKIFFFSFGFYLMNPVALDQWKCKMISQWVEISLGGEFLFLHAFQSPNFYIEFILLHRQICVMCTQKNPVHIFFYFMQLSVDSPYVILNFRLFFPWSDYILVFRPVDLKICYLTSEQCLP